MSVLEEEQFTAFVERTEKKWECHICKKIFDRLVYMQLSQPVGA